MGALEAFKMQVRLMDGPEQLGVTLETQPDGAVRAGAIQSVLATDLFCRGRRGRLNFLAGTQRRSSTMTPLRGPSFRYRQAQSISGEPHDLRPQATK